MGLNYKVVYSGSEAASNKAIKAAIRRRQADPRLLLRPELVQRAGRPGPHPAAGLDPRAATRPIPSTSSATIRPTTSTRSSRPSSPRAAARSTTWSRTSSGPTRTRTRSPPRSSPGRPDRRRRRQEVARRPPGRLEGLAAPAVAADRKPARRSADRPALHGRAVATSRARGGSYPGRRPRSLISWTRGLPALRRSPRRSPTTGAFPSMSAGSAGSPTAMAWALQKRLVDERVAGLHPRHAPAPRASGGPDPRPERGRGACPGRRRRARARAGSR